MPLNEHGVDKIIGAVGKSFVPATLDRFALRHAIHQSDKSAEIISVNRRGARARKRLKRLKQIRKTAKQLKSLLEVKDDASDWVERLCGEWPRAMLSRLIIDVEASEEMLSDTESGPATKEWLAGVELPCVFKEYFHREPGASRNKDGDAGGPCVRFIEATMVELGKPYTPASILRAMTRLRRLQDSRGRVRARQSH